MFEQIMVPLDGSALAERALECATSLAETTGAALHLVQAVEPLPGTLSSKGHVIVHDWYIDVAVRVATGYLDAVRARLLADGIHALARIPIGHTLDALLQEERRASIDLVVMCSRGHGAVASVAPGSVATGLLRHGTAPVLLVSAFGPPVSMDHAVVPLDGSARAEEAVRLVERLAGPVIREVMLLRVIATPTQGPEAERYLEQAARSLQARDLRCSWRVERGDPAERIVAVAVRDKLVVMTTRKRGALLRWALGSVADRVARDGATTVRLGRAGASPEPAREVQINGAISGAT